MKWGKRLAFVVGVGGLFVWAATEAMDYRALAQISDEARVKFAGFLKPLSAPDLEMSLGKDVSLSEVELGRLLFNDPILSRNNDVSCATCHLSNHGFAEGSSLPVGASGKGGPNGDTVGRSFGKGVLQIDRGCGDDGFGFPCQDPMFRNVPSTINVAFRTDRLGNSGLLWDGRFGDLGFQTILPIHTPEELCGFNPVPADESKNVFRPGGPLFKEPVEIRHSHLSDYFRGVNLNLFNAQSELIRGVPSYRPNGTASHPTRNECLAIAVAKVRSIPEYREMFKMAFGDDAVTDLRIGRALTSFVATHVALNTPFDRFAKGENALTEQQIRGMAMFLTPLGGKVRLGGKELIGAGCVACHSAPLFGGKGFASLGVRGDPRSSLSKPKVIFSGSGFLLNIEGQRGGLPTCIKEGVSGDASITYVPDIGRANATTDEGDCFKFRIPPLRNVVETYPYFHHGVERGQGYLGEDFEGRVLYALEKAIRYHLRGAVNHQMINRLSVQKVFYDSLYLKDNLVPVELQNFPKSSHPEIYPFEIDELSLKDLVSFVAWGLYDESSTKTGVLGNDVSHPSKVPSGLTPSITRDHGNQSELPPAMSEL